MLLEEAGRLILWGQPGQALAYKAPSPPADTNIRISIQKYNNPGGNPKRFLDAFKLCLNSAFLEADNLLIRFWLSIFPNSIFFNHNLSTQTIHLFFFVWKWNLIKVVSVYFEKSSNTPIYQKISQPHCCKFYGTIPGVWIYSIFPNCISQSAPGIFYQSFTSLFFSVWFWPIFSYLESRNNFHDDNTHFWKEQHVLWRNGCHHKYKGLSSTKIWGTWSLWDF